MSSLATIRECLGFGGAVRTTETMEDPGPHWRTTNDNPINYKGVRRESSSQPLSLMDALKLIAMAVGFAVSVYAVLLAVFAFDSVFTCPAVSDTPIGCVAQEYVGARAFLAIAGFLASPTFAYGYWWLSNGDN